MSKYGRLVTDSSSPLMFLSRRKLNLPASSNRHHKLGDLRGHDLHLPHFDVVERQICIIIVPLQRQRAAVFISTANYLIDHLVILYEHLLKLACVEGRGSHCG